MARPSNIQKLVMNGDLSVNIENNKIPEVFKMFLEVLHKPAEEYKPLYNKWHAMRRKIRKGRMEETDPAYLEIVSKSKEMRAPLQEKLRVLCTFSMNVPAEFESMADETMATLMKNSGVVHSLVGLPEWRRYQAKRKKAEQEKSQQSA